MVKRSNCLTSICLIFIAIGFIFAISSIKVVDLILKNLLDLTPGGVLYDGWMKPAPNLEFKIYFFNWTNPEDFTDLSKKPAFTEVGPFRFDVRVEKSNVTFNPENNTMTYEMRRWFQFNREESAYDLDFEVTILNQLSAAMAYQVRDSNFIVKASTSIALSSYSSVHMKKTVGELMFEGSTEVLLDMFRKLPIPAKIPDKFGFFYGRNGSSDGIFNIGTGHGGTNLGMLYAWNGDNKTSFYEGSCESVVGAAVDFYTNKVDGKKVEIYNPELCRRFPLDYAGKQSIHGIQGQRYEVDDSVLDNGTLIPGNECYCGDQCIRYGAFPATLCQGKVNNYLTLPHLMKVDPFYTSKIEGMQPNPKKHTFYTIVEPTTGILLEMRARLQMNLLIQPISGISMFRNAPTALFPVLWVETFVRIPEDGAFGLGILLSLRGVFICIGVILILLGILIYMLFVFELRKKKKVLKEYDYTFSPKDMVPLRDKDKMKSTK